MIPQIRIRTNVWYYDRPLGKNLIGEFLSNASQALKNCPTSSVASDIEQSKSRSKIANHSARKTAVTALLDNNIDPIHVAQLSGHKSQESLKSYHTASSVQQRRMSNLINTSSNRPSTAAPVQPLQAISSTIAVNTSDSKKLFQFNI